MRRRRKRDIVIELTALLDVIMIMIFMVMNENGKLVSEVQSELGTIQQENIEQAGKIDELSAELADTLAMLDEGDLSEVLERLKNAENKLEAYQAINDEVIVLNVELRNNPTNTVRYLTYGKVSDSNHVGEHLWRGTDNPNYEKENDDPDFRSAINSLKVFVNDYVEQVLNDKSGAIIVCVVLSYDPVNVYQTPFLAVDEVLKEAEAKVPNGNFRYRTSPISLD